MGCPAYIEGMQDNNLVIRSVNETYVSKEMEMGIVLKIKDRIYLHGKFLHTLQSQLDLDWYTKILAGNVVYFLDLLWHHECDDAEMSGWNLVGRG